MTKRYNKDAQVNLREKLESWAHKTGKGENKTTK